MMTFFLVYVHFPNWFSCGKMADAPFLTLQLHHDLEAWATRDADGARAAIRKLDLHTDYLNGRNVIFALASDRVSNETKQAMADALNAIPPSEVDVGKPSLPRVYSNSTLESFVNEESFLFFKVCSATYTRTKILFEYELSKT